MFRDRRQERREERRGTGAAHYRMRQKLVLIGDDYWIENDQGERVFKVDGKALRIRKTLILEDSHGRELLKIEERVAGCGTRWRSKTGTGTRRDGEEGADHPAARSVDRQGDPRRRLDVKGTVFTTSTPSRTAGPRSLRCPRSGSGSPTPMGSKSPPGRTQR